MRAALPLAATVFSRPLVARCRLTFPGCSGSLMGAPCPNSGHISGQHSYSFERTRRMTSMRRFAPMTALVLCLLGLAATMGCSSTKGSTPAATSTTTTERRPRLHRRAEDKPTQCQPPENKPRPHDGAVRKNGAVHFAFWWRWLLPRSHPRRHGVAQRIAEERLPPDGRQESIAQQHRHDPPREHRLRRHPRAEVEGPREDIRK